jgi:hypothetical protein
MTKREREFLITIATGFKIIIALQSQSYDWRFPANQFVFALSPLRITTRDFVFSTNIAVVIIIEHPF